MFTWTGRRLVEATKGSKEMSFTYDDNGIRTSKTIGNVTHNYYLNGSQIVAEQWSDKLLVYLYDVSGTPIGMMYRTSCLIILFILRQKQKASAFIFLFCLKTIEFSCIMW